MWKPEKHADRNNLQFCWLRAVEWDAWPFFLSQPIVPCLMPEYRFWIIVVYVAATQVNWTVCIRRRWMSVWWADAGMLFTLTKWAACPLMAFYFYRWGYPDRAAVALLWPLLLLPIKSAVFFLMAIFVAAPFQIELQRVGVIQRRFMEQLGYTHLPESEGA